MKLRLFKICSLFKNALHRFDLSIRFVSTIQQKEPSNTSTNIISIGAILTSFTTVPIPYFPGKFKLVFNMIRRLFFIVFLPKEIWVPRLYVCHIACPPWPIQQHLIQTDYESNHPSNRVIADISSCLLQPPVSPSLDYHINTHEGLDRCRRRFVNGESGSQKAEETVGCLVIGIVFLGDSWVWQILCMFVQFTLVFKLCFCTFWRCLSYDVLW